MLPLTKLVNVPVILNGRRVGGERFEETEEGKKRKKKEEQNKERQRKIICNKKNSIVYTHSSSPFDGSLVIAGKLDVA